MDNTARAQSAYHSETALSVVSDWTPWIVAAAPALAVGFALERHKVHIVLVVIVALAVELAGVFAGHALTEAREYNIGLDKKDRRRVWPLGLALAAYVLVGVVLAVILDMWPDTWIDIDKGWPVLMPILAVIVYWVNGERVIIRHLMAARVQAVHVTPNALAAVLDTMQDFGQSIEDLRTSIQDLRVNTEANPSDTAKLDQPPAVNASDKAAAMVWLSGHPDATEDTIVQHFNVSPRTARRYLSEFRTAQPVKAGANGNGAH